MDRQYCVLLYSTYSEASRKLIEYITSLSIDVPRITGMSFLCVDYPEVKKSVLNQGLTVVPLLLIKYFNGDKQVLNNNNIYLWVDEVLSLSKMPPEVPNPPLEEQELTMNGPEMRTHIKPPVNLNGPPSGTPEQPIITTSNQDIMSKALAMQKSRE